MNARLHEYSITHQETSLGLVRALPVEELGGGLRGLANKSRLYLPDLLTFHDVSFAWDKGPHLRCPPFRRTPRSAMLPLQSQ